MNRKPLFFHDKVNTLWLLIWIPWILIFCVYCVSMLKYPYEWEPGEGARILYAQRLLEAKPIYSSNQDFPMLGNCYPPLYFILTALIMKTGIDPLICGRLISIVSIILIVIGIYSVVKKLTGSKVLGIISISSFLFPSSITNWYPLARMDSLCSMLLFASTYIIFRNPESIRSAFFASLASVAALYTKQTAIFIVAAMVLFYLSEKKWKQFLVYGSTIFLLSLLLFLLAQDWTNGWFFKNLFSENTDRIFIYKRYRLFFGWVFRSAPTICIIATLTVACDLFSKKYKVWILFFLGALANALLIGANGSGMNYFISLWAGVSIFFVLGLQNIDKIFHTESTKKALSLMILILTSFSLLDGITFFYRNTLLDYIPKKSDLFAMRHLDNQIKNSKGNIFVDRFPYISIKHNKNRFYVEPALIQELYHAGRWKPDKLLDKINGREFSMIFLLSESLLPRCIKEAVEKNYFLSEQIYIGTFEINRNRAILVYRNN